MNKKNNILIVLLLLTVVVTAQKDACLADVQRVYSAWTKAVKGNNSNTIYLKYSTEITTGKTGNLKKNQSTIEVISDRDNSYFFTLGTKIFQDDKATVTILSDKKLIVINGVVEKDYKEQKMGQFEIFKDSVFSYLKTDVCKTVVINDKTYKRVVLKMSDYGAKLTKVATIYFLLDELQNTVKEIKVKYVPGHRFYAMKMNFLKQNLNYTTSKFKTKAISKVLSSKGVLLSKYAEYRLIDNRN